MIEWEKYERIPYQRKPNKNLIPINRMTFEQLEEFNDIYLWCFENMMKAEPTTSKGICTKRKFDLHSRYQMTFGNQSFELTIVAWFGCYRFLLEPKKAEGNTITGQQACRSFYKVADNLGISLKPYLCTKEEGERIKESIQAPHIELFTKLYRGKFIKNVYHLDFNSSYASRIAEAYPELAPVLLDLFDLRHEKDGYYKHVMTNSIGAFQSKYCVNYFDRHSVAPYQLTKLAKAAVNGTRSKVELMLAKLRCKHMVPILTNTDGIWYYSANGAYHDDEEGDDLCQWKNDHVDCEFLLMGVGAYQYRENGKTSTVVRGICNLDADNPDRSTWEFGAILKMNSVFKYVFIEGEGVKKIYDKKEEER